jgi:putative transcriptional regulator
MVVSALASDVIGPPRIDLWAHVLRRQPMPLALLASHPIDVERN